VNPIVTERFWKAFEKLPQHIQRQARRSYQLWKQDPYHPSRHFKQVHSRKPIFSTRIGMGWRALSRRDNDDMIWFWIGSHEEYNTLIRKL
jgi:hypothetical protein